MMEEYRIYGLTLEEMKKKVNRIKAEGRTPFFHYTHRATAILCGQLVDQIISDLYATFDNSWHQAFIVPYKYKEAIEGDSES